MNRARKLFPKNGREYELFDCSVLLFVLTFVGLVIAGPTATQAAALAGLSISLIGILGGAAALYGVAASYVTRLTTSGFWVTTGASAMISGLYLVSAFFPDVPSARVMVSAVLYGWIARRLVREEDRFYCDPPED